MRGAYAAVLYIAILLVLVIAGALASVSPIANTASTQQTAQNLTQASYRTPQCSCGTFGACSLPNDVCARASANSCFRCVPSTSASTTSKSTTSTSTTTIYPGCPTATPNGGDCNVYKQFGNVITNYPSGTAGNGGFVVSSSGTSNTPVISSVINFNNNNAQNLITCPVAPNPTNTIEYFSTDMADGIYGNRCLAPSGSLTTNELLDLHTAWNTTAAANSLAGPAFNNLVRSDAYALTYSGAASYDGQTPNISNGYSTDSYVFQGVPSSAQGGIWTWYAEVANIPSMSGSVSENASYPGLHYDVNYSITCSVNGVYSASGPCGKLTDQYTYNYKTSAALSKLNSATLPVPTVNPSFTGEDWISYNGGAYGPASSYASGNCGSAYSLSSCLSQGGYSKIGTGTLYYTTGSTQGGDVFTKSGDSSNYYLAWNLGGYDCIPYTGACLRYNVDIWSAPQKVAYPTTDVGMYPYLLYNTTTPAVTSSATNRTEMLNLSFDLYSPINYLSAANLDPFPIYTGSGFFATETTTNPDGAVTEFPSSLVSVGQPDPSAFNSGSSSFVTAETPAQIKNSNKGSAGILNGLTTVVGSSIGSLNNFIQGSITSPVFMTESPNNYLYVVNSTSGSSGFGGFSSSLSTYLYVLRFVPAGYLNMTNNPPSAVTATNYNNWKSTWENYWKISTTEQSYNLYITKVYNLTNDTNSWWGLGGYSNTCTGSRCINDMLPMAMTTDYADDVFILGTQASSLSSSNPTGQMELAGVLSNGTIVANNNLKVPSGFQWPAGIASDAGGSYVYVPNTTGSILAYSTKSNFSPAGSIPLSYSPAGLKANMSTVDYMAHGGPFGNTAIANFYSTALAENSNGPIAGMALSGLGNDTPSYHSPITIASYQGLIYVLDQWTFYDCVLNPGYYGMSISNLQKENSIYSPCQRGTVGPHNSYYDNLSSSILMLRVFLPNGTEVKINPVTNYSDLVASNSMALGFINAGAGSSFSGGEPPYGWPLSANLSYIAENGVLDGYTAFNVIASISYCAAGCNFTPSNLITPYEPIGPLISNNTSGCFGTSGLCTSVGLSLDYNGSAYMLSNVSTGYSNPPIYIELTGFKAPIYNYSKISFAANAKYFCYLSTNSIGGNPISGDTPCMTPGSGSYTSAEAHILKHMTLPFINMPSSFSYAESQGSPSIYQSALSTFSTFGSGQGSSGSGASTTSTTSTTTTIPYNTIGNTTFSSSASLPNSYTYINTSIGGAFLVPLHYSYSISKQWSSPTSCTQVYTNNGVPTGGSCKSTYTSGKITLLGGYCNSTAPCVSTVPFGSTQNSNADIYATAQYPVHTSSLNYTIQGGATLLQYLTSGKFYNASLSDRNVTLPPLISYNLLTDRLIGSVYINQTVNPDNNLTSPLVVNYTRILDYGTKTYSINSAFGTAGAYQIELSNPITPVTGANQVSATTYSCTCTDRIFGVCVKTSCTSSTTSNPYPGPSQINLTNAGPNTNAPFSLFSIYKLASYSDSFSYSLNGSKSALGYDRLVYLITDEFGNLLKAPLDADIANLTDIQLSHSINTNVTNPNESNINVSGSVLDCQNSLFTGCKPLVNAPIYIYYDANLNYYNSTSTQTSNPTGYSTYAENCAFSPLSIGCILADPTHTRTWTSSGGSYSYSGNSTGVAESGYIMFHTQYNSSSKNTCANEPNSLLASALSYNCNLYGYFGLPQTASYPTGTAYCVPTFLNGTGHFTTQLGLVDIVHTNSSGNFSKTFNVCGTGTAKIITQYYGSPPPQPMLYTQPDIANATYTPTQFSAFGGSNANTLEFNYTFAPYSAVQTFPVGIYALSFGTDDALVAVASVMALLAIAIVLQRRGADAAKRPG